MALRLVSVLGAGWGLRPWLAWAAEIEKEYFPLSGGIDNGVQVTITATAMKENGALIEFVDRERKPAFAFQLMQGETPPFIMRSRHASFGEKEETFGGWPGDALANGPFTFVFTKRKFGMAVSIGSARYPWYDYSIADSLLLTHVAVSSGLTDAEVTLERPVCSQECHPDECRDSEGRSVCDATDSTGCNAVVMGSESGVAASCTTIPSTSLTTPGGSMHCCDGADVTPRPGKTLAKGTWVRIAGETYLQRACTAFSVVDCPNALADSVARIDNTSSGENWRVFVPSRVDTPTSTGDHAFDETAFVSLPFLTMFEYFKINNKKVTVNLNRNMGGNFVVDRFHGIITEVNHDRVDQELSKGRYVDLIRFNVSSWDRGQMRLTRYNRWAGAVGGGTDSVIFASDLPIGDEEGSCTDLPFEDRYTNTCAEYTANAWCFKSGFPTAAGATHFGLETADWNSPQSRLPSGNDTASEPWIPLGNRDGANVQCCECGGGDNIPDSGFDLPEVKQITA